MVSHVLLSLMIAMTPGCKKKGTTEPISDGGRINTPVTDVPKVETPATNQDATANLQRAYFDFDSSSITSSAQSPLSANAKILKDHGDIKVEVQGHCDERGTSEYNLALGSRRAESAKNYLVNQGVSPSRVTTISYGEERPIQSGSTESAWSQNRRAEFRITAGGDGMVEDTLSTGSTRSRR